MGQKDLILVARRPSAVRRPSRRNERDAGDAACRSGCACFLVNRKNKVNNLSRLQLESVFLGNTRLWRGVGGTDWPILALTRNEESGSQELFGTLLLKGRRLPAGEPIHAFPAWAESLTELRPTVTPSGTRSTISRGLWRHVREQTDFY
jgi:ABC-type phosphate transport system substrate-binding protein